MVVNNYSSLSDYLDCGSPLPFSFFFLPTKNTGDV